MSFFIAYFPFDFECAKLQHFIGMAIGFGGKNSQSYLDYCFSAN